MSIATSIVTLQIFPVAWDWRRVSECGVAAYQAVLGAVAFAIPSSLDHSGYAALLELFTPREWGLTLWLVAFGHVCCMYFNGRSPYLSATLRTVACGLHLGIMLLVAGSFIAVGDYYRLANTMFLIMVVLSSVSIATEDVQTCGQRA